MGRNHHGGVLLQKIRAASTTSFRTTVVDEGMPAMLLLLLLLMVLTTVARCHNRAVVLTEVLDDHTAVPLRLDGSARVRGDDRLDHQRKDIFPLTKLSDGSILLVPLRLLLRSSGALL